MTEKEYHPKLPPVNTTNLGSFLVGGIAFTKQKTEPISLYGQLATEGLSGQLLDTDISGKYIYHSLSDRRDTTLWSEEISGDVPTGTGNLHLEEKKYAPGKVTPVNMNDAGMVEMAADAAGGIGTKSLGGCTGIAAYATGRDGVVRAMVSHYDPVTDRMSRLGSEGISMTGDSPSNRALVTFAYQAQQSGAENLTVVAAYEESAQLNPDYGNRKPNFDNWYFLDQIENTLDILDRQGVSIQKLPYNGDNHTLVVSNDPTGPTVLFDGQKLGQP